MRDSVKGPIPDAIHAPLDVGLNVATITIDNPCIARAVG